MGVTYNWGTTDGDFGVATNWQPNGVPGTLDTAAFAVASVAYTVSGDGTLGALSFTGTDVTFTDSIEAVGTGTAFSAVAIDTSSVTFDGSDGGSFIAQREVMVGGAPGAASLSFINGAAATLTATDAATGLDIGFSGIANGNTGTPGAGTVIVDDSTVTALGGVYVGVFSFGSLDVTDGALFQILSAPVTYASFELGVQDPSVTGIVTVDGGATLDVGIASYIGVSGTGVASFSGGASATFAGFDLGAAETGSGTLAIDGASVTSTAAIIVGDAGSGTLSITGGSTAYAESGVIGAQAGGSGSIDIGDTSGLFFASGLSTGAGAAVATVEDGSNITTGTSGGSSSVTIGGGGGTAQMTLTGFSGLYAYGAGGITVGTLGTLAFDPTAYVESGGVAGSAPIMLAGGTLFSVDATDDTSFGPGHFDFSALLITGGSTAEPSAILAAAGGTFTVSSGITFVTTAGTPDVLLIDSSFDASNTFHDIVAGDTIDIAGEVYNTASYDPGTATLVLSNAVDPATLSIADDGGFTATSFIATPDGNGGTDVSLMPCFVAGTRIATDRGPRAVETLRPGDCVRLADGGLAPVVWIGARQVDPSRHAQPAALLPVRITAGALADGVPTRDLLVSPDHALLLDGRLVEARRLLNGGTVRQDAPAGPVCYLHVELPRHAVLLAEGAAAESYLDTGNRSSFGAGRLMALHPEFAGTPALRAALSCAPFATDDATLRPIWQALADRAARLGAPPRLPAENADAAPRLHAGGRRIAPIVATGDRLVFPLPPHATSLRLTSAAAPPSALRPWADDRRALGLSVRRLRLHAAGAATDIPLDGPAPGAGWHAMEARLRWTDGDAALTLPHPGDLLEIEATPQPAYAMAPAAAWAGSVQQRPPARTG